MARAREESVGAFDFIEYVLSQLPAAPARVLEVGCGEEGGVAPALAAAGYELLNHGRLQAAA